jgi:hypothetical protein
MCLQGRRVQCVPLVCRLKLTPALPTGEEVWSGHAGGRGFESRRSPSDALPLLKRDSAAEHRCSWCWLDDSERTPPRYRPRNLRAIHRTVPSHAPSEIRTPKTRTGHKAPQPLRVTCPIRMPRIRTSSDPRGLDNPDLVDGAFVVRRCQGSSTSQTSRPPSVISNEELRSSRDECIA